jgi:hypothetical protein
MNHSRVEKAAKKAGVPLQEAIDMIVYDHELNFLIPKSKIKEIPLDLDLKTMRELRKIAKALNVSIDAVIGMAISSAMEIECSQKK